MPRPRPRPSIRAKRRARHGALLILLTAAAASPAPAATRSWNRGPEFSAPTRLPTASPQEAPPAGAPSITIAVDRSRPAAIAANLSGANVTTESSPASFGDDAIRAGIKSLLPSVLRWPGGTVDDCFSWSSGTIAPLGSAGPLDIETAVFAAYPQVGFGQQVAAMASRTQPLIAAKGGNPLGDINTGFAGFATALGAKFLVVVNTISDTVDSARQLAATVARLGLPVAGFELGNEPFFLEIPGGQGAVRLPPGAPPVPGAFADGVDYLTKMKPYYDAIKKGYATMGVDPGRAVVAIAGGYAGDLERWNTQWAADLSRYAASNGAWWDAVAYHFYPPEQHDGGFAGAMAYANAALSDGTTTFMDGYRAANWSAGKPLFVSEYNATFNDRTMNGSVYAGIFSAEYVARMSVYPETAAVLMHELLSSQNGLAAPDGAIDGSGDWDDKMAEAGRAGQVVDTTGTLQGLYFTAQILGLELADRAVNVSDASYATRVSGGNPNVATLTGTMPAVYAQAYHGRDGTTHIIVTNKGANPVGTTITVDGAAPATGATLEWLAPSAGDPSEQNTGSRQAVTLHRLAVKGRFTLPGYSVSQMTIAP